MKSADRWKKYAFVDICFSSRNKKSKLKSYFKDDNSFLQPYIYLIGLKYLWKKLADNFQIREHSWPCLFHNMKPTRPWMLANPKIIWQFHAHPVHQKVSRFFRPRYIGDNFFLGPNLVSFNRAVVPCEISKVNFRVETKNFASDSMSEEI
jgi:hypothetical protein